MVHQCVLIPKTKTTSSRHTKGLTLSFMQYPKVRFPECIPPDYSNIAGTELPDGLVLVHEFYDHYSLQASNEMTLAGEHY